MNTDEGEINIQLIVPSIELLERLKTALNSSMATSIESARETDKVVIFDDQQPASEDNIVAH